LPRRGSGQRAERRALWHYRLRGYRILGTNVWCAGYELDLIVRRGKRLVFVEVKSKSGRGFGLPEAAVDEAKQRRLVRAAETWLARRRDCAGLEIRFEVAAIDGDALRRVPLGDPA
jgi:putative endonuclease